MGTFKSKDQFKGKASQYLNVREKKVLKFDIFWVERDECEF